MKQLTLVFIALIMVCNTLHAEIITQEVEYLHDGVTFTGYLAYNDELEGDARPAVMVVHEWWGHNEYARKRARDIAEIGFIGFALDMYGDGKVAEHPDDAKKFMNEVASNLPLMQARFEAALEALRQNPLVADDAIAAIGYCFGGAVVLNMARTGADLKGVASFHGSLTPAVEAKHGQVKARVIVFHGESDSFVSMDQVAAFEKEMQSAAVDYQIIVYPGVEHSFTNPQADSYAEEYSLPLSYDADADDDSWVRMQEFLVDSFVN